jgi:hypothetical protein
MAHDVRAGRPHETKITLAVALAAVMLALGSARPFAGCWNDGSRLATVEGLVDHHTLAIDDSVFVQVPWPPEPAPYPADDDALCRYGTLDKLYVGGHFYSDKSPVPAVLLAGVYQLWEWVTGWTARSQPGAFCRTLTLAGAGLAYVLAVMGMQRLTRSLGLRHSLGLMLCGSFALATVALPYARHVNNHILLLGVTAWLSVEVAGLARDTRAGRVGRARLAALGTLAGLAYTIDLGAGPVFLGCTGLLVVFRTRRWRAVVTFALAALPWLVSHHVLNYAVGGCWRPANALAEHFRWPGSPFKAQNLTGGWVHESVARFIVYAASMLFGKRGFVEHNLPLFLLVPLVWGWLAGRRRVRPEVLWALGCCGGTWFLYAATSNNSSGQCLSIRWFVPLLAPAYYLLALGLRAHKSRRAEFTLLSAWGVVLVALMSEGPWSKEMVPGFWLVQAAALLSWAWLQRRGARVVMLVPPAAAVVEEPAGAVRGSSASAAPRASEVEDLR